MTRDGASQLERAWAVLVPPASSEAAELTSYSLDLVFSGYACRVALDGAGSRHLLVPANGEMVTADSRPSILGQSVRKLIFGRKEAVYVDLSCADMDLYPEFDEVVTDVLDAIQGSDRPGEVALRTVARWRRLFRSRLVRGLSAEGKVGLFAELTVLSALLDADPGFKVDSWRGPLREPHDFEAPSRCIEVKAIGSESAGVVIHGLDQLDLHDGRPLDLALVTVIPDPDGTTIWDLIQHVQARVSSVADFRGRLKAAGWAFDPTQPDTDRFSIAEVLRVSVSGTTPRLVSSSLVTGRLSAGLHDLSYRVELTALLPLVEGASLSELAVEAVL